MAYLIGTDEAGYGPNLGPLVISVTAWKVPDELRAADLYTVLQRVVNKTASTSQADELVIADSKQVYKQGGGLAPLERPVLACLRSLGHSESRWKSLWASVTGSDAAFLENTPWNREFDTVLPCDTRVAEIDAASRRLASEFRATGVSLHTIRSAAIFPDHWNDLLEIHANKADALADETLQLLHAVVNSLGDSQIIIQCDKFGGRNQYGRLLQQVFPEYLIEIVREARSLSIYRWGPKNRRVECRFAANGENFLPTALASMTSKYLRELAMRAFNHFWRERVPGLKATAGYPVDARRFKRDIESAQRALGIEDRLIWRIR
jgi:ribonuclease HII